MMNRLLLTLLFFLPLSSFSQTWNWATKIVNVDEFSDVAMGKNGDVIGVYAEEQGDVPVLYRMDKNGRVEDSLELAAYPDKDECYQLETDAAGNIYIIINRSERYLESEDDDADDVDTGGIYLEKYSPSFRLLRAVKLIGDANRDEVNDFVMDSVGNCYIVGRTMDVPFLFKGKKMMPGKGGSDFLIRVNADLKAPAWIKMMDHDGTCCGWPVLSLHVAVDKKGNCLMTGSFSGVLHVTDKLIFTAAKIKKLDNEAYLVGINGKGEVIWARIIECESFDSDVICLSGGKFIYAGFSRDSCLPGSGITSGPTYSDYLAEIDPLTGKQGKMYRTDSCAFTSLCAGKNNDFYCLTDVRGGSCTYRVFYFDNHLKPKMLNAAFIHEPVMVRSGTSLFFAGSYAGVARFGEYAAANAKYLDGSFDGFFARLDL